jgi:fatty-acyl-CoA synthase
MMNFPLNVSAVVRRAATLFPDKAITTRLSDGCLHKTTYGGLIHRARRLSVALKTLGVKPGERVGTLAWNTHLHLEAYLGVPCAGAVLHTLNIRLHPDELAYTINHAEDRVLLVDASLLTLLGEVREQIRVEHIVVLEGDGEGLIPYEQLLASADAGNFVDDDLDEASPAAMCYTSGTTGRPKGVVYSHRAIVLHSLVHGVRDCLDLGEADVVCPVVPMFHVNAWGLPFTATMFGAAQVFPGRFLDAVNLLGLMEQEGVTITAGVPTVWLSVLQTLDEGSRQYDLKSLRMIISGGSAAPLSMIRGFEDRHGLNVVHAWGMTEMTPFGSICNVPSRLAGVSREEELGYRSMQGTPLPFVEFRAVTPEGIAPWDGRTMGELEVRGPWVADSYYKVDAGDDRFTDDGWFRTGDIVTIDPHGCMRVTDRSKDLVKSGGEWISSVALEGALMGHPAVGEAAVIAVPHPKWSERPMAVVVLKPANNVSVDELQAYLARQFPKFWVPEAIEFVTAIPRNPAGKFLKSNLRERYQHYYAPVADPSPAVSTRLR